MLKEVWLEQTKHSTAAFKRNNQAQPLSVPRNALPTPLHPGKQIGRDANAKTLTQSRSRRAPLSISLRDDACKMIRSAQFLLLPSAPRVGAGWFFEAPRVLRHVDDDHPDAPGGCKRWIDCLCGACRGSR